uniref:Uncharacterized protein n=1 Tax=Malurus cyaneus samueli TaxID=2593467 RepID=A0A8C5T9B6_9PASS
EREMLISSSSSVLSFRERSQAFSTFRFPGSPWSLVSPRTQVVEPERAAFWSEDILATPMCKGHHLTEMVFAWGYPMYLPPFPFQAFPWKSQHCRIMDWVGRNLKNHLRVLGKCSNLIQMFQQPVNPRV